MGNCIQSKSNKTLTINMITLYMIEPKSFTIYINEDASINKLIQISLTQLKIQDNLSVKLIFSDEEYNRDLLLKDIGICNEAKYKLEYSKNYLNNNLKIAYKKDNKKSYNKDNSNNINNNLCTKYPQIKAYNEGNSNDSHGVYNDKDYYDSHGVINWSTWKA